MTTVTGASLPRSLLGYTNPALLPLPTMRNGNFVVENKADKATLFADHLATQCVPSAHLLI
jgi:hypothetical protein